MSILLDDEDALFDAGSFTLYHNDVEYHIDPTLFFNFSRKFAAYFQAVTNNPQVDPDTGKTLPPTLSIEDEYEENAFATYIACCQMKPIAPSGIILVDLLVIAEDWDSPTLITKIESLLASKVPPNELIRLFAKLLREGHKSKRIETIISMNLPRFIDAPLFSTLPFEVIERMIAAYPGKLTPAQLMKLCYAASAQGGMDSIKFVKRYSFDNMKLDQINDLCETFMICPYRKLRDFFAAMGRLLEQLKDPLNEHKTFKSSWTAADNGTADNAFAFYKEVQAKNKSGKRSATEETFLKTAANRGNAEAQFEYGKMLLDHAKTEDQEDIAVEYLIQAAAKGFSEAIPLLEPYFNLNMIDDNCHLYVYQSLSLQIVLLGMNNDNINPSFQSILALKLSEEPQKILLLAQDIMKAVQIRQRNEEIYANLLKMLSEEPGYEDLKQQIFSLIFVSLFNPPHHQQFIFLKFLYKCKTLGVYQDAEIEGAIMDFVKANAPIYVQSSLFVYYWFAPMIEHSNSDVSSYLFMKALTIQKGMFGIYDEHMLVFKKRVRELKENNWNGFDDMRQVDFYTTEFLYQSKNREMNQEEISFQLMHALVYDDLASFKKIVEENKVKLDRSISNYIVDLVPPQNREQMQGPSFDEQLTLIQFAAMQGSKSCFLYLLRRGALFLEGNNPISAICAACGQCKFILSFITNIKDKMREEMLRMAGRFNNTYLLVLLLQNKLNIDACDENGMTALHMATRAHNNGIVKLLCAVHGINVNAQNVDGCTPLHYAVIGGKVETVQILSEAPGIDVNAMDRHGSTPLHYAAWNGDVNMVKLLITLDDIDVNVPGKLQRTPLHEAAKCGFLEIVRVLVKAPEIDLNPTDKSGRTPYRLAMKKHQVDVVQFLNSVDGIDKETTIVTETSSSSGRDSEPGSSRSFLHSGY
ncbi:hypothetical protein TVAG_066400 [Trichomonas vaginalis G3]|uniref:Uncharacterized protein n=1 Tax=Trichomonas vaginalis (strain ATCC PRA-98 / G3) TaxID=412133 RepID=A2FFH3_TRIV3|nr:protein ubiquitination [Trichomonas vaginalis G3]EAX96343.1 hypothetical protein TVAG_066400 [Trichomonas vaginalis G3]KAI5520129.1 protein ubiquitination [Trichomonas vaginalis G3]|eukprot:XP_001309273.1 hypothetical protein [Trichomonas vaginalis G3]